MLKITFKKLRDPDFVEALAKIADLAGLPGLTAYRVSKLLGAVQVEQRIVSLVWDRMCDEYVLKQDGIPVVDDDPRNGYKVDPKKLESWSKALADFEATEAQLDCQEMSGTEFFSALTPRDILALSPIWSIPHVDD